MSTSSPPERKGLRFEVAPIENGWGWFLRGKDDVIYAQAGRVMDDENGARADVAAVRKVFKGAAYAKVITVDKRSPAL